jgi:hypothetical protein
MTKVGKNRLQTRFSAAVINSMVGGINKEKSLEEIYFEIHE